MGGRKPKPKKVSATNPPTRRKHRQGSESDPFEFTVEEAFHKIPVVTQATAPRPWRNGRKREKVPAKKNHVLTPPIPLLESEDSKIEFLDLGDETLPRMQASDAPIPQNILFREEDLVAQIRAKTKQEEIISAKVEPVSITRVKKKKVPTATLR
eukprot:TRINITY_DN3560_c0_g1_i1.p1 TRINITY_DN3560_c0_g1~~TRINITY_DN3560_c0_g1_i1.p1  ORF type:complete len:154 (-),score=29.93 TRINITY_DN3560_c0_g1_i1:20-481(-)